MELHQLNNGPPKNGDARPFIPQGMGAGHFRGNRFGMYRPTAYDRAVLISVVVFNCLLLILALGALFVGIFMNTYRKSYSDLCSDNEWFVAAGCMLAVGSLLLIFVFISFIGIYYRNSKFIFAFIVFLLLLFFGELATAIYAFVRRRFIESRYRACMTDAYQQYYGDPSKEHVTEAWDLFQDRFHCCGVTHPLDYRSNTHHAKPPKACGGTLQDARGRQPCFEVIKREVLDNFYIIGGSAIGIAGVQIITVILCGLLLRTFYKREEYE